MEDQPHIYLDINEEIEQKIPDSTTIYPLYSDPEFNLKILAGLISILSSGTAILLGLKK